MVWLNGMASLEQLEKVYDRNGGGGFLKNTPNNIKIYLNNNKIN